MAIRYPIIIFVIIGMIIACVFFFKKKQATYKTGTKIANTSYIKENPYYKEKLKRYQLLSNLLKGTCLLSIVLSSVLLSRVSKVDSVNNDQYKRDIFLCMDVSSSVDELNHEVVDKIKEIVNSLKDERFGISIFNTTSVTLAPLTNDHEYILEVLDKIKASYEAQDKMDFNDEDYFEVRNYIINGTLVGSDKRGGSLIGDGLATCVYNFPNLDEDKERTRIVILTTDNELYGTPIVTLDEAATIAKQKNVKLFGISTEVIKDKDLKDFENAAKKTGGKLFRQDKKAVSEIIKSIEKESKSLIKEDAREYQVDVPTIPFLILLLSMVALIYLDSKVIS